jgi:hypothetical protein
MHESEREPLKAITLLYRFDYLCILVSNTIYISDEIHVSTVTGQVSMVEQEQLTPPVYMSSPPDFSTIRVLFINFKYVVLVLSSCFIQEQFEDIKGVMRCRK